MIETIESGKLETLAANQNKISNQHLPVMTQAVFITLDHLKDFISRIEEEHNNSSKPGFDEASQCDTIRINLVRFEFTPNSQILSAGKDKNGKELTQTSLVFVPVKAKDRTTGWTSVELVKNGSLLSLCVCNPSAPDGNNTGVCPPNQGCPPSDPND